MIKELGRQVSMRSVLRLVAKILTPTSIFRILEHPQSIIIAPGMHYSSMFGKLECSESIFLCQGCVEIGPHGVFRELAQMIANLESLYLDDLVTVR